MSRVSPSSSDLTRTMILAQALRAAANEMNANLIRSAFSAVVREAQDCSAALLDVEGNVVAQAETIPMQTAALSLSFRAAKQQLDLSNVTAGHAIMMNDPYSGGQHLNDIIIFQPIFYDGVQIGWAGNTAHHLDIGGGRAGVNTQATDLIQEGLVIRPVLFEVERDWHGGLLERIFLANIRTGEIGLGDVNAQFAANHVGITRMRELAARYGSDVLRDAMSAVLDYSAARMTAAIESLPDGIYHGQAYIDRDVFEDRSIGIKVEVRISGPEIVIDFAGTDAQVRSMYNCPRSSAHAAVFAAIRSVIADKGIPANDGCNRPIKLILPEGSLLNPSGLAPVRARMTAAYRSFDAVHEALRKAIPDKVPAQGFNTTTGFHLTQHRTNGYSVFVDVLGGGYGAGHKYDGADACDNILSNCRNTAVEAIEQIYDFLRVESYELVPNSGGAGRWRGGLGFIRSLRILEEGAFVNLYSDHFKTPPKGAAGGEPGSLGSLTVKRGDETFALSASDTFDLQPNDLVIMELGGGGGFGDPKERPTADIALDIASGLITAEHARRFYGYKAADAGR